MIKKLFLILAWLVLSFDALAATYNLPGSIGSNPFNCSGSGSVYTCNGTIDLPEDSVINLTADVTLNITGHFRADEDFLVQANGYTLNINATQDVQLSSNANFTGNITAGDDISIGEDSTVTGNLTAADNLTLDQDTVVNGICSPTHTQCTGVSVPPPTGVVCETFLDNFNSSSYSNQDGTINWSSDWIETGDNNAVSDGDIQISNGMLQLEGDGLAGGHSAFGGAPSIEREADLSAYDSATLTFDYSESGNWEGNDDIEIWVSSDGGSNWILLHTFTNDQSASTHTEDLTGYIAADTRIAFVEKADSGSEIFYFDNVQIEACGAATTTPSMDFHFDEPSWTGIANEVIDSSSGANHASISAGSGVSTIALGQVCRAGQFDGIDDYLVSSDIFSVLRTTASMSFWIKTTQTGNNTNWQAPGVAGVEQSGGGDDIFWGWLDATGHIGISKWDTPSAKSSVAINDGVYHHVVLTRDSPSGGYKIYIDGVLNASGTTGSGDVGTSFTSIGRIEDTGGSPEYLQAELDELLVFDTVLSDTQVSSIYTNQRDGNNYDGSSRVCLDSPLVEWHFDESSWGGSAGEVVDSQGALNATAVNGANTGGSNPAIAGNPGTCRYGTFDGADDYVDLTGMTDLSDSFTISAWIYANDNGNDQRIYVDDQNNSNGFGLSLGDGGNGQLRFFSRSVSPISVDTQSAIISTGRWYHVAAVHDASAKTRQIYVDGTPVTLTGGVTVPTYSGTWGVDSGAASIGGENNNSGEDSANFRFNGNIDEVRVYDAVLSADQINTVMNLTRTCAITGPDHYVISHSTTGVTCEAESVTVTAHDASDLDMNPSSSTTITLTTSIANDGWALRTGAGTFIPPNQYTFSGGESSAQFWLTKTTATTAPHMDVDVSDGSVSDNDSGTEAQAAIAFSDSGFRFYADAVYNNIATQIAGKSSDTSPGQQALTLKAVQTNTDTGACEAVLTGVTPVQIAFECSNPSSCVRPLYMGATSPSTSITGTDSGGSLNYQNVSLDFGVTGEASFVLNYPDSGAIQLHAQHTLPTSPLPATGITLNGTSNLFVSRPFGFHIDAVGNPAGSSFSDTIYTTAGSPFTVNVSGSLWNSADDSDNNGIPDNHDDNDPSNNVNLGNNSVTLGGFNYTGIPNFGQEGAQVDLEGILIDPFVSSYADADFPVQNLVGFSNGADSTTNAAFNDVGIIELRARISTGNYLGIGTAETANMISKSGYVGRFTPAAFSVEVTNDGMLDNTCSSASAFTYIGQDFGYLINPVLQVKALNTLATITENYRDDYVKLNTNSLTINVSQDSTTVGNATNPNPLLVSYNPQTMTFVANNDGTVDYTLGADQYRYGDSVTSNAFIKLPNSEVAPFVADIDPLISQITDTEVTTAVSQTINLAGNNQRFGRIRMSNTFGSELMSLQMPMIVEYFNGTGYQLNQDDNCTQFNDADLTILADNLVTPGASTISVTNPTAVAGVLDVTLTSPGEDNVGRIDLSALLSGGVIENKWLRYDWDADGSFDNDPSASATFGIYSGDSRQIYFRQIYP